MNGLVPAGSPGSGVLAPLTGGTGSFGERLRAFTAQPAVKRALPWFAGLAGAGLLALTWATLSPAPQRVLYSSLADAERASVVATLDQAGIDYTIDNGTGALTVGEDDVYRARMLVASDGSLAAPESGTDLIENLPMGASRTLEGDRLRAAQERELTLTVMEIDGVEAVRVHIAKAERSVFVREDVAPSASVMVRMARGRQLTDGQVMAIVNLVAASVPGLGIDAVKVVDQHGKLLTQTRDPNSGRMDLQAQMEAKLNAQVDHLLAPMFGTNAFTSQVQVELDMNEVTSARESYDKDGTIRRETTQLSQSGGTQAGGIPGVLANTPPAEGEPRQGAPEDTQAAANAGGVGESSATRLYEMGREVSVSNLSPGTIKYLSVAVAIDQAALAKASAADINKVKELVTAAVGARQDRGDQVTVVMRAFEKVESEEVPFYETSWFGMAVRNGVAILGVLLVLLLAVRPAINALRSGARSGDSIDQEGGGLTPALGGPAMGVATPYDRQALDGQIELAQRIARENPDDAVLALRRLLAEDARPGVSA
ncbi:flagellar basal-body MS-ring/collar protein FliF [Qipengyuania qiaonensis]|uniref:Flagellar M-ring protein n=1 Tax=Qipengyuania qiaonensis TaxID=2867240 RepID=A0ABS7J892_9SPHN|nr:flagellar basal-body MS-ring/collar protein FliF [Qipengyuania qiaonensis]MBX7481873.1 flagellar M-ring protein FliF [Qipengyuania qiaonensis]